MIITASQWSARWRFAPSNALPSPPPGCSPMPTPGPKIRSVRECLCMLAERCLPFSFPFVSISVALFSYPFGLLSERSVSVDSGKCCSVFAGCAAGQLFASMLAKTTSKGNPKFAKNQLLQLETEVNVNLLSSWWVVPTHNALQPAGSGVHFQNKCLHNGSHAENVVK